MARQDTKKNQPQTAAVNTKETQMQAGSRDVTPQAGTQQGADAGPQMGVTFTDWASI